MNIWIYILQDEKNSYAIFKNGNFDNFQNLQIWIKKNHGNHHHPE